MLFELLQASRGCAHYVEVWVQEARYIVSIYLFYAHTAEEPVGDGPRGRCYGPVNPGPTVWDQGGKGVNTRWYLVYAYYY